jgi:hypothetical protein
MRARVSSAISSGAPPSIGTRKTAGGTGVISARRPFSKYGAKPTTITYKGKEIRCASRAEAKRFGELILLERAKEITNLKFHPRYPLLARSYVADCGEREIGVYVGDARYQEARTGVIVLEEIKGFETAVWKLKQKIFAANYPLIDHRIVKAGKGRAA